MIITPAETLQDDITYTFFSGEGNIEDDFLVSAVSIDEQNSNEEKEYTVIKFVPRSPTSQIKDIRLWISHMDEIKRIEVRDSVDTLTLLTLSNIQENSLIEEGKLIQENLFSFTPPEGTEIIHQ